MPANVADDFRAVITFEKSGAVSVKMTNIAGISTRKLELMHQALDREYLRMKGEAIRKVRAEERKARTAK